MNGACRYCGDPLDEVPLCQADHESHAICRAGRAVPKAEREAEAKRRREALKLPWVAYRTREGKQMLTTWDGVTREIVLVADSPVYPPLDSKVYELAAGQNAAAVAAAVGGIVVTIFDVPKKFGPVFERKSLQEWSDAELAAVLLSQLWRWLDAGGKSEGRSYDALLIEAVRDTLRLPLPIGGDVDSRPKDQALLDEVQRRRLLRPRAHCVRR